MEVREGYKQTEVGVIPESWGLKSYDNAFLFLSTATYSRSQLTKYDDVQYLHYGDIHTKYHFILDMSKSKLPTIPNELAKKYTMLIDGDIVMADASEDYDGICKSVEIKNIGEQKAIAGLHTFLLRDHNEIFANGFKGYFASSNILKRQFDQYATGMKVYGVSKQNLKKILIPVPPKPEQKAIAQALSDVDALIESLEQLIDKKRHIKQGAMQELLKPKEGWDKMNLGEIAKIKTGTKNNQDKVENGKYSFFVRSAIVEKINSYSYDCEAILIPGEGNIGNIFHYIKGQFDVHQRVYAITNFNNLANAKYIFYYMKKYFGTHALKNSVKATVDSLRLPTFLDFEVNMPSYIEQKTISNILSDIDDELEALETKLRKIKQIKEGMMHELLTGRIRLV